MSHTSPSAVRWGILGASDFALHYMGPAIHAARGAALAAVATSDPVKAEPFAAYATGLRVFTDYDALLADPDIDAVYVPLPNHLHVEWTKRALAAGKPVLTEKPIAMTEAEFDDLIAARDAAGILAAEAYMVVHHAQWRKVRDLLAEGAIGDLAHVQGAFCYNNAAATGNIRNRPETGGGALRDIGVYPFGTARFATGSEPEAVSADITWENDVDVITRVNARFPGFTMTTLVSMRIGNFQEMRFLGSAGRIDVRTPFTPGRSDIAEVTLVTDSAETLWRYTEEKQYVNQVETFGAAIRSGADYPCPLEFSRGTQRMIDLAFASVR